MIKNITRYKTQVWVNDPDVKYTWYGESYNKKFLDTMMQIRAEKGADYFRHYPSKGRDHGRTLSSQLGTSSTWVSIWVKVLRMVRWLTLSSRAQAEPAVR